ncbi:MAG: DMT family transporter [Coriobacteriia bacterium]|nr:DMT family transporter [Coriobacteriia bacterium]
MSNFATGIVCALVGASLWGFSGACAQFLFAGYSISPLFLTTVRMLGAGAIFLAVLAIAQRDKLRAIFRDRSSLRALFLFGSVGLLLSQLTYVISVSYTNAGTATVLQSLAIVFVMLFTCFTLRRLPRAGEFIALVCAFTASLLIATKGDLGTLNLPLPGLIWGIVNALSVAYYLIQPRKLFEKWGSLPVTGLGMLFGGFTMLAIWLVFGAAAPALGPQAQALATVPALDAIGWLVLALLVLVGTFGAFALYIHGVSIVGSMNGGLLGAAEPVSATLFSTLWLGTLFTWADWAGLILMVATILLVSLSPANEKPAGAGTAGSSTRRV